MSEHEVEVEIEVRESGPYRIRGRVRVVDADGEAYDVGSKRIPNPKGDFFSLCRCGGSSTKPFCDGTHKRNGFEACERVASGEWRAAPGGRAAAE
jgi:CDGSH-type Zn-finger protein